MSDVTGQLLPGSLAASIAGAAWVWILALLLGASVLPRLAWRASPEDGSDADASSRGPGGRLLACAVVGVSLQTTAWLALGAFGALTPAGVPLAAASLTLGAAALGGPWILGQLRRLRPREAIRTLRSPLAAASLAALAFFLGGVLLAATWPTVYYDDLTYHLGLARQALLLGHWPALDTFHYSFMPAGWDATYVLPLSLGGGLGPQLANAIGLVLLAHVTFRLARRGARTPAALAATALLLIAPLFAMVGSWASNDVFVAVALASALDRVLCGDRALACGLVAGAAWGAKYTSLPAIAGLGVAAAIVARGPVPRRARVAAALLAAALLLPAAWHVRALVLTGDPLYPAFPTVLGGELWDSASAELLHRDGGKGFARRGMAIFVLAIGDLLTLSRELGYPGGLDAAHLPVALVGILLAAVPRLRRITRVDVRGAAALAAVGLLSYVGWCLTFLYVRFVIVLFVALTPFAAAAIQAAISWMRRREALGELLAAAALLVFLRTPLGDAGAARTSAYGGKSPVLQEARDQTLPRVVGFAVAERGLAEVLPPEARVLVIGEGRLALIPRPALISSAYDQQEIVRFLGGADGPEEVTRRARAEGLTHVIVNAREAARWHQQYRFGERLGPAGLDLLSAWISTLRPVGRWQNVTAYELPR